jgi:hypothetical protein
MSVKIRRAHEGDKRIQLRRVLWKRVLIACKIGLILAPVVAAGLDTVTVPRQINIYIHTQTYTFGVTRRNKKRHTPCHRAHSSVHASINSALAHFTLEG